MEYLNIGNIKKECTQSGYFSSEEETMRLKPPTELLRKFNSEIYMYIFEKYESPYILDLGCGNDSIVFDRLKQVHT